MADLSKETLVSVVVPFRNAAAFLAPCCRSIQEQTYTNWQALLINDNSSDGSLEIVREFVSCDPRFRVIQSGRTIQDPAGPWLPRNRGLEAAEGAFIAFLDADDVWHSEKLERQLNMMQQTWSEFCVTSYYRFSESTKLISECRTPPSRIRRSVLELINPIPLSTVVAKRECLKRGFRPVCHEDHDAWRRLFHDSQVRYCCVAIPLLAYRIHKSNLTGSWSHKLNMRCQLQKQLGIGWRLDYIILFFLLQVKYQIISLPWRLRQSSIYKLGFQPDAISTAEASLEAHQASEMMAAASGNEGEQ